MSTRFPIIPKLRKFQADPSDGRGWALLATLVAVGYYAAVMALGAYPGLLMGLVVPVSLGSEAYARALHPDWRPIGDRTGGRGRQARGTLLPTVVGLFAGFLATAVALLLAGGV